MQTCYKLCRDAWDEGFHLKVSQDGMSAMVWGRWHIKHSEHAHTLGSHLNLMHRGLRSH